MIITLRQKLYTIEKRAYELFAQPWKVGGKTYDISDYSFRFNKSKTAVGMHYSLYHQIELSSWFIEHSNLTNEQIEDVLRHEIAHAIDYAIRGKTNHDRFWKMVAVACGANPSRFVQVKLNEKVTKWSVDCQSCDFTHGFHSKPRRKYESDYRCKCGGKLKLIQNY